MKKKEVYRLRYLLHAMKHNRIADTSPNETMDKFFRLYEEGIQICDKTINRLKPMR